jgi:hypothetical protein
MDSRLYLTAELDVIFEHELQHARDFCEFPTLKMNRCGICMRFEKKAHEVNCGIVFAKGSGAYKDCVACGVWTSCRLSGACTGADSQPRPEPCDWSTLGLQMPGIPFPVKPDLPGH